jgi:hypothetical protein
MSPTDAKRLEAKWRSRKGISSMVIALSVAILVIGALAFYVYTSGGPTSNTVYCGVFEYLAFPAQQVVGDKTSSIIETVTTSVSYVTSTSIAGQVGQIYSNTTSTTITDTVNSTNETAGVETICKYISNPTTTSSK